VLYVSAARRIQGCIAAEHIKSAFAVVPLLTPAEQLALGSCTSAVQAGSASVRCGSQVAAQQAEQVKEAQRGAAWQAALPGPTLSETLSSGPADTAGVGPVQPAQPHQQKQHRQHQQPQQDAKACASLACPPTIQLDRSRRLRAVCGVRLAWVSLESRRSGLATRLLDACRCHFMPGYVLPRQELAFR
jgi:hypothetical protein